MIAMMAPSRMRHYHGYHCNSETQRFNEQHALELKLMLTPIVIDYQQRLLAMSGLERATHTTLVVVKGRTRVNRTEPLHGDIGVQNYGNLIEDHAAFRLENGIVLFPKIGQLALPDHRTVRSDAPMYGAITARRLVGGLRRYALRAGMDPLDMLEEMIFEPLGKL